jgi:serine/threonine protein kinase
MLMIIGVAHGDIKTDNMVIEMTEQKDINLLLIDFGSSVITGQVRLPTRSEPWNAPELGDTSKHLSYEELAQTDLYSFGLVCSHLLLPAENLVEAGIYFIRSQEQTDDQWAQALGRIRHLKSTEGQNGLAARLLGALKASSIPWDQKTLLGTIFDATILSPEGRRKLPWEDILPYISQHLSSR